MYKNLYAHNYEKSTLITEEKFYNQIIVPKIIIITLYIVLLIYLNKCIVITYQ